MKKKKIPEKEQTMLFTFREVVENKRLNGKYYTAANYVSFINKLSLFLGERAELFALHELTKNCVEEYIEWLHNRHPDKPQTVDFYFRGFRTLFNISIQNKSMRNLI